MLSRNPLFFSLTLVFLSVNPIHSEDDNHSQTPTTHNENVVAALQAEADGDLETRKLLLSNAIASTNSTPARWQSGQINVTGRAWQSIEESIHSAQSDENLKAYWEIRKGLGDRVDAHLWLAQWCIDRGMPPQARAHLERILDFDPNNLFARDLLGYRQAGNDWISPSEIAEIVERAERQQRSIEKHGKKISKLVSKIISPRKKTRDKAVAELMNIKDADAVGAIDAGLASEVTGVSKIAIDWMAQIDTAESSRVIARYSLMHPNNEVRQYAMEKLVDRPLFDFVPELLEMLSSTVSMTIVPSFDNRGNLVGYRQAFAREDFDGKEFFAIERGFEQSEVMLVQTIGEQRIERSSRDILAWGMEPVDTSQLDAKLNINIRRQAEMELRTREEIMERQNQWTSQRNKQIAAVVSRVSGRPYTEDPIEMWRWWDRYNETEYQRFKPERYQCERITTSEPTMYLDLPPSFPPINCECFVAGTPVLTCQGLQKIEEIVTGDLVLSRNLMTGELTWKPVLRPTQRPASPTMNIELGNELFCCSNGHLFWVSGSGWKKASELRVGDILHGAEQPSRVTAVSAGESIETYNLEVADNSNYFVGKQWVMTHDVTPRKTNRQKVPGMELLCLPKD